MIPDWAIQSYSEGNGPEAQLARMLIAARQELARSHELLDGQCKANVVLGDGLRTYREREALIAASLRNVVLAVRETKREDLDDVKKVIPGESAASIESR